MPKPLHSTPASPLNDETLGESPTRRWSIGAQLIVTVNAICVIFVLLFHVYDYRKETQRRMRDKQIALHEEAITIRSAIPEVRDRGIDALQQYVDRICAQMDESHSPGHHIAVQFDGHVLQSTAHHRESDGLLKAMTLAKDLPDRRGRYLGRDFIVSTSGGPNQAVQVLEFVDNLQREVMRDSLRRFGASAVLAIIAAVIVDVVLLRIVVRPLERLVRIVDQIRDGTFGRQINGFRSRELSYLSRAINQMSHSLADSDRQRNREMAKARRIQQNLLPPTTELPNASFAVHYAPADDVAGDFYDVRYLPDGGWLVFLADVTGHGIPAAMNATLLKAYLAEACERNADMLDIMRHVNRRFAEQTLPDDFATCILIRRPPNSDDLQVVNAGHDAALLRSADGRIRECHSSGLLLGVDESADWDLETLRIVDGDRLLLSTDGVSETFCEEQNMFGHDRVVELLNETATVSSRAAVQSIVEALTVFRGDGAQLDDVTIIMIDFQESKETLRPA
jgi:phosphoserine phosphatase RsbU/P